MTTKVEKSIEVNVPVSSVYNQWTQFEEFPQFMGGISEVRQVDDKTLHWVAEIAGVKREWDATILEQVPDQKIAWAATDGATNAGAVYFAPLGAGQTLVRLSLEYEPEGLVEKVGDKLSIVEKRAEADLEKFKTFIETKGSESGGWRGDVKDTPFVGTPGVDDADSSRGDSGKAGMSTKGIIAGVAAAAGVAAVGAMAGKSGDKPKDSVPDLPPTSTYDDVTVVEVPPTSTIEGYPTDTTTGGTTGGSVAVDKVDLDVPVDDPAGMGDRQNRAF